MVLRTITATEASRSFSNILNKVNYQGESYQIKRGKEIIAKIIPVGRKQTLKIKALNELFKHLPQLNEEDKNDFASDIQTIRSQMEIEDNTWD
jgi:antitoxin (DNA-binding transcriptional repressor) of toxin-antitoxin stability system